MKATHNGTCQICGGVQAAKRMTLTEHTLAKHGYSVRWGMFVGICRGSDARPFEQSTDLIEDAIRAAAASADRLETEIAMLRTDLTTTTVWLQEYQPGRFIGGGRRVPGGYTWRTAVLVAESHTVDYGDGPYTYQTFREEGATTKKLDLYGVHTLAEAVAQLNGRRADFLAREAAQWRQYADWQRARIARWEPAALQVRG